MKVKKIITILSIMSILIFSDVNTDFFQDLYNKANDLFEGGKSTIINLKKEFDLILAQITDPVFELYFRASTPLINQTVKTSEIATVRSQNSLNDQEIHAVNNRKIVAKKAQEALLGMSLEKELTIGVSFSGGGDRALVSALGSLCGLDEIKMLDCITYLSLLSGSTWLAPWFAHGNKIRDYTYMTAENLTTGLDVRSFEEAKGVLDYLLILAYQKKPVTIINVYNALLINTMFRNFGSDRFTKHLIAQFEYVKTGKMPFPINTAVILDPAFPGEEWMEFSPVEIGSEFLGAWVPTWGFNRNFQDGKSTDFMFDYPFYLGTYGGALGLNIDLVYRHSVEKQLEKLPSPFKEKARLFIEEVLSQRLTSKRKVRNISATPLMSVFRNFTYGLKEGILKTEETIELTDAGLAFNNPIPPLLRRARHIDVIMIFDNSAGQGIFEGNELKKIVEYVKRKNIPFPQITDEEISAAGKRTITVFKDNNPEIPIVMYLPRFKDEQQWSTAKNNPEFQKFVPLLEGFSTNDCLKNYCNTFNFTYKKNETEQLSAFTEFNVITNKDTIIDALKFAVERNMKK